MEKLNRFMSYFNDTIGKPMNWTYAGPADTQCSHHTSANLARSWAD